MRISENPSHSKVIAFSNKCLMLSFSWERGFSIGSGVTKFTGAIDGQVSTIPGLWTGLDSGLDHGLTAIQALIK